MQGGYGGGGYGGGGGGMMGGGGGGGAGRQIYVSNVCYPMSSLTTLLSLIALGTDKFDSSPTPSVGKISRTFLDRLVSRQIS